MRGRARRRREAADWERSWPVMWGKAAGMARAGRHRLPRSPDRTEGWERPKAADCSHSRRNPDESRGAPSDRHPTQIGSAAWRERWCQHGLIPVGAGTLEKTKIESIEHNKR